MGCSWGIIMVLLMLVAPLDIVILFIILTLAWKEFKER